MNVGSLHGYSIKTVDAYRFWTSNHKCNILKAIIAFSINKEEANTNLRRMGYGNLHRKKAIAALGIYINNPDMRSIPYSTGKEAWWNCAFKAAAKGAFIKWELLGDIDGHWGRAYLNNGDYIYIGPKGTIDKKATLLQGHVYRYSGVDVTGVPLNDVLKDFSDQGVFKPAEEKFNLVGTSDIKEFFKWFDPDRWVSDTSWKES